jgi:hypothetical protein
MPICSGRASKANGGRLVGTETTAPYSASGTETAASRTQPTARALLCRCHHASVRSQSDSIRRTPATQRSEAAGSGYRIRVLSPRRRRDDTSDAHADRHAGYENCLRCNFRRSCPSRAVGRSTPTPAAYRAKLNAVCRTFTPRMRADWAKIAKAEKAKDWETYGYFYAHNLVLILAQDVLIEAVSAPAQMRREMLPILRMLAAGDCHIRLALRAAQKGDSKRFMAEANTLSKTVPEKKLNRLLDAAGLGDCGSNQS